MLYTDLSMKVISSENTHAVIARFAKEQFRANDAYELTSGMWNIDSGENDVRAITKTDSNIVQFCCRDEFALKMTVQKIKRFYAEHSDEVELIKTA